MGVGRRDHVVPSVNDEAVGVRVHSRQLRYRRFLYVNADVRGRLETVGIDAGSRDHGGHERAGYDDTLLSKIEWVIALSLFEFDPAFRLCVDVPEAVVAGNPFVRQHRHMLLGGANALAVGHAPFRLIKRRLCPTVPNQLSANVPHFGAAREALQGRRRAEVVPKRDRAASPDRRIRTVAQCIGFAHRRRELHVAARTRLRLGARFDVCKWNAAVVR